jgi:hypothetical protein
VGRFALKLRKTFSIKTQNAARPNMKRATSPAERTRIPPNANRMKHPMAKANARNAVKSWRFMTTPRGQNGDDRSVPALRAPIKKSRFAADAEKGEGLTRASSGEAFSDRISGGVG